MVNNNFRMLFLELFLENCKESHYSIKFKTNYES